MTNFLSKRVLRNIMGITLIVIGISLCAASVYVGLYLMLLGGIVDFINACKAQEVLASAVAWAIFKIITAKLAFVCILIAGVSSSVFGATMLLERIGKK